jgi:hypothetical protein
MLRTGTMETSKTYENFPAWIVTLSNAVSILIYLSGFIITLRLGWIAAILYLVFIMAFEIRLISRHCIGCYYWGKICGFGKGRISSLFFEKADPSKFCDNKMSWKDLIPDLLITLVPFIIGIVLLIIKFDLILLFTAIILILLTTIGNGFIRGNLTCKYCKQREIGCPAEKFFNKSK